VDLQDVRARRLIGVGELDLAVDAPRPQQRRVEDVEAVGRHDHLDVVASLEAIELVEQLEHRALHLRVAAAAALYPLRADGVDLVHEDERGRVLARHDEELPHHARPLADVLLYELGAGDADEGAVGVVRHRARQQRLARAGRAVHEHA